MVILIGGLPGSGKTYFAERLALRLHALHLSSDRIRKELFPVQRVYSEEEKQSVYQAMLDRMSEGVLQKRTVILDATFYRANLREPFILKAHELNDQMHYIYISSSDSLIKERTTVKRADSEADYEVYLKLKDLYEPFQMTHLHLISEIDNIEDMLDKALEFIS